MKDDDWKGEAKIRAPRQAEPIEACAAVRAQHDALKRAAKAGLSEAEAVRRTGISLYKLREIRKNLGLRFRDGRRKRAIEGRV